MNYASSLSTEPDFRLAAISVCRAVREVLTPRFSTLFVSHTFLEHCDEILSIINEQLGESLIIGCTGESIVGTGQEIEDAPAISLWSTDFPEVGLTPYHIHFERTPDGLMTNGLPDGIEPARAILALGDPYSTPVDVLISRFEEEFPGIPLMGGMASGAHAPGGSRLFLNKDCYTKGVVGVVIRGGPRIQSIVSQGCRPVGNPYVVTRSERNIVWELGGEPALKRLKEVYETLDTTDRELVQRGLHLGIAIDEYRDQFERGDFLIANVAGFDQQVGAFALASLIRTGQTVQFHVRDANSADLELNEMLARYRGIEWGGGLLFSCNGRGTRLFPEPNHDARSIRMEFGSIPLGGLFCQGELGPIGLRNFIHGFTASIVLFGKK